MASGDKRIGIGGDCAPFGTHVLCVGPLLNGIAALDFPVYVPVGRGTILVKRVRSVETVALAGGTADSVITIRKGAQAMTGGILTIALAGSAPGVEDFCDIVNDEHARVPEETRIVLSIAARAAGTAGEAVFFIEFEPTQT